MKRVLLIAYHFPPLAGSSGIQRTLRLAQQLPQFGWQPTVLTCQPQAYERTSPDLAAELPADLHVSARLPWTLRATWPSPAATGAGWPAPTAG